jgi:hypothetical protein
MLEGFQAMPALPSDKERKGVRNVDVWVAAYCRTSKCGVL